MSRLRLVSAFVVNTLFAVLGPEYLGWVLVNGIPAPSILGVLLKAWIANLLFSALLGAIVQHLSYTKLIRWAWPLPTFWLMLGIALRVLEGRGLGGFTGSACVNLDWRSCIDFFAFTVPAVRAVSYSIGASLSAPGLWSKKENAA